MSKVKSSRKQISEKQIKNTKGLSEPVSKKSEEYKRIINDRCIDESKELLDQSAKLLDDNIKLLKKVTLADKNFLSKNENALRKYGLSQKDSSNSNVCDFEQEFSDPDSISISSSELLNADKEISNIFDKELSLLNVDLTPKLKDVSKFKYFKNEILPKEKTDKPLEYIISSKPQPLINGSLKNNMFTTDVIDPKKKTQPIVVINRSKVNSKLLHEPNGKRFMKGGHDDSDKKDGNFENFEREKDAIAVRDIIEFRGTDKKTKKLKSDLNFNKTPATPKKKRSKYFEDQTKLKDKSIDQVNEKQNKNQNSARSKTDTDTTAEKILFEDNQINSGENSNNLPKVKDVIKKRNARNNPYLTYKEMLEISKRDVLKKKIGLKKKDSQSMKNTDKDDIKGFSQQNEKNESQPIKDNVEDERGRSSLPRKIEISTDDSLRITKKNSFFKTKEKVSEQKNSLHTYKQLQAKLEKDIFKENKSRADRLSDRTQKSINKKNDVKVDNNSENSSAVEDTTRITNTRALLEKKKAPLYYLYNRNNSTSKGLEFTNNFSETNPIFVKSKKTYLSQEDNNKQIFVCDSLLNENQKKNNLLKTKLSSDDENKADKMSYLKNSHKDSKAKTLLLPQDKITTKENFSQGNLVPRISAGRTFSSPRPITLHGNSGILTREEYKLYSKQSSSQAETKIKNNICPTSPREFFVESEQPYTALNGFKLATDNEDLGTGDSNTNTGRSQSALKNSKSNLKKTKPKKNKSRAAPTTKVKVTKTRTPVKSAVKDSILSEVAFTNGSHSLPLEDHQIPKTTNFKSNEVADIGYQEQKESLNTFSKDHKDDKEKILPRKNSTDLDSLNSSEKKTGLTVTDGENNLTKNKSCSTGTDESVLALPRKTRKKKLKSKSKSKIKSSDLKYQNDSTDSESPLKKIAEQTQYINIKAPLRKNFSGAANRYEPLQPIQQEEHRVDGGHSTVQHDFFNTDSMDSAPLTSKTYTIQKFGSTYSPPIKQNIRKNSKLLNPPKQTDPKAAKIDTTKKYSSTNKFVTKKNNTTDKLLSKAHSKEQTFFLTKSHTNKLSSVGTTPRITKFRTSQSQGSKLQNTKRTDPDSSHSNMSAFKYVRECEAKLASAQQIAAKSSDPKSSAHVNALEYFKQLQENTDERIVKLDASKKQNNSQSKSVRPTVGKDEKSFNLNANSTNKAEKLRNLYSMNNQQVKPSAAIANLTNIGKFNEKVEEIQENGNVATTLSASKCNPYNLDELFPSVGSTAYRTKAISIVGDNYMNKIIPNVKNTYSEKMKQHDSANITAPSPSLAAVLSNTSIGKNRTNQYKSVISPVASYINSNNRPFSSNKIATNKPQNKTVDKVVGTKKGPVGPIKNKPTTTSGSRFPAKSRYK